MSVHLSFQSDKAFSGLAASYSLSLLLLSRALEGVPFSLLELDEGGLTANYRIDIADFASQSCSLLVELLSWDFTPDLVA